ncbi:hypothetical protein BAUCODRAFT_317285 [Baudoinia panamericana UAMH 10762]|uniref:Suppressor of forked domain-containing protein n=1 Tax=Baudoinia panamericana (strain UAMH 10762) TaxID=717646 RepID=M2MIS8_BAUPA|nr:uncharacterized protein BAUCODRAFT_317285 [Baudoinia panamericana UAMH 10762]EMC91173.1 hypothetical protein BAUCODRAFT_317285 [Baudoinia panamericana UAMH 10762]
MADFSFSDDHELQNLNAQVLTDPEEFEHWEKLVRAAEAQEGGLNRNSSPQAIAATRDVYDRFLAHFPLFFGYWKKYADIEFSIAGTEAAEMVYERGIASISTSVDLWANYCGFKAETNHDIDMIRELFERGADSVGLDFLAAPFWDKYLEFEERLEAHDRMFAILERIVVIPMHAYARYFERYRALARQQPIQRLAPQDVTERLRSNVAREAGSKLRNTAETERELRSQLDAYHMELFQRTQDETTKRWTFEQEVKRPYFHVNPLDEAQLENWRKYLDFEEGEGDYIRTKFLYERCLVTTANYDEFWFRYARWMQGQGSEKEQEVRTIYQRASCFFVPISQPAIRIQYSMYEEAVGNQTIAADVLEAVLMVLPSHFEAIIALANLQRRQHGHEAALGVLQRYRDSYETTMYVKGALVGESARLVADCKGQVEEARKIFRTQSAGLQDCSIFWMKWFFFEVGQPIRNEEQQAQHYQRVKGVYDAMRESSQLARSTMKEITGYYLAYLCERGPTDAMKELIEVDRQVNGPPTVQQGMERFIDDGKMGDTASLSNGLAGAPMQVGMGMQGGGVHGMS